MTDEHLRLIGLLVARLSFLAKLMELTLIQLTGAKYGLLIMKKFMFRSLAGAFHDVMKEEYQNDQDYLKRLKKIMKDVRKLNERRNDLIHAYWRSGPDVAIRNMLAEASGMATYSVSGSDERENISVTEMQELADKARATTVKLYDLIQEKDIL